MLSFDCNETNSYSGRALAKTPKEPVDAIAYKNQVVQLKIPFQTPRASEIRTFMHTHLLNDETQQRLFVFRKGNGWTNIHLEASAANPKITWLPHAILHKVFLLEKCEAVSRLTVKKGAGFDDEGATILFDDIEALDFDSLEPAVSSDGPPSGASTSGADPPWKAEMERNLKKHDDRAEALDTKLGYLINVVEKLANGRPTPPASSRSARCAARKRAAT